MALYGAPMGASPDMVSAKLLSENWQFGSSMSLNLKMEVSYKFEGCSSSVVNRSSVSPVEDEMKQKVESCGSVDQSRISSISLFPKEMKSLPKPLSATDVSSCQSNGSKLRVAYQGVPGAYSEDAALKAYPKCKTVPCNEFEAAFKAVESLVAEKAVLPIENSVAGSVHKNYDLLLSHRLHIVGEVHFPVHHCLLGLPGVTKEELKYVLSHPQALAQCEFALNKLNADRLNSDDTAGAAQTVATNHLRHTGVIASARAGLLYGLDILAENIQDDCDNITRFLILAREPIIPGTDKPYKTTIVFTVEDSPGVLVKALAIFALRGINLSRIESRPRRRRQLKSADKTNTGKDKYFEYLFYVDFDASMAEPRSQSALGQLQEFVNFLRILGSYPTDTTL